MAYTPAYVAPSQAAARTLFGHVMWLVAATAGLFALGCYAGRDLSAGWSIAWFLAGFGCLIALNFARRASSGASIALLLAMGLLFGLGMGPAVAYYTVTIFAGLTLFDFQRLRRSRDLTSAPFIAASIFLDALNVFLYFLRIFGGRD